MTRLGVIAVTSLLVAISCAGPRSTTRESVNALCPMGKEPVVESGGTVIWHDVSVGFCCKRCEPMFAALSDDEKADALEAVGATVHE